jgi:superfamily II DNA or RNA helicase
MISAQPAAITYSGKEMKLIDIIIHNSISKVEGLSIAEHNSLKEVLSYSLPPVFTPFGVKAGNRVSLLAKSGMFPTGLLETVKSTLKAPFSLLDMRVKPTPKPGMFNPTFPHPPYIEQLEIVDAALQHHRGTISAVTGFGKSLTMMYLVNALQVKTLIVVPNLTLKNQLTEDFTACFGSLKNITIENIDSPELKKTKKYDCLIIDEAHHVAAKTYRTLNSKYWNGIYYRLFFTATPFRSRSEEDILFESIAGRIIYRVDFHKAVENGYITPLEAFYVTIPKTKTNAHTWRQVYKTLVVENDVRNNLIARLVRALDHSGVPTLVLVKEIVHGKILSELCGSHFANGESEDSIILLEAFSKGKIKTLVGTTGIVGEGVNTKPAEFIIITGLGRSKNSIIQQIGRGLRRSNGKDTCKVIIFDDNSHKFTKAHFKEQCKILLDEYNLIPDELKLE